MSGRGSASRLALPALLSPSVRAPLPVSTPSLAAVAAVHSCRSCGAALERIGTFYWHAALQPRCPVTCWPASSVERPRQRPHRPAVPAAMPAALTHTLEGALTMSKRGGNKAKRPPKAPMPNQGPKSK